MSIPANVREDAETALTEFCKQHSSGTVSDQLRYKYELVASAAILLAERPGFMNPAEWASVPVAKFRYSEARGSWSLYWSDSNARWHRLSNVPAGSIRSLLQAVETDAAGVFWGK
ncbi:MAG TPA: DUF3024 domain-containing protein [Thermoanaerobaculia bacterium]